VGPQELVRWTGGTLFWGFAVRSPETYASEFTILRTLKCRWSEGVEKSNSHVSQSFSISGFGSRRSKVFDIMRGKIAIAKTPIGKSQR
jgi:hypothetical protein